MLPPGSVQPLTSLLVGSCSVSFKYETWAAFLLITVITNTLASVPAWYASLLKNGTGPRATMVLSLTTASPTHDLSCCYWSFCRPQTSCPHLMVLLVLHRERTFVLLDVSCRVCLMAVRPDPASTPRTCPCCNTCPN